jgi:hypothetical protein
MSSRYSLIIESVFITAVFGYLAFHIVRAYLIHLGESHPPIKRFLIKFHIDGAA